MARIHLVHWNAREAAPLLDRLRQARHQVAYEEKPDQAVFRKWREAPPDAIAIDLSRLPSHGREIAVGVRCTKSTRHIPIVFVGGDPVKVAAIREKLPDAVYAAPDDVVAALKEAMTKPPAAPVVPAAMMDRYAGRSAAQKLGIRAGSVVAVIDAPRDYAQVIGLLPAEAALREGVQEQCAVALWFVHDAGDYRAALSSMREIARGAKLWILWRKQKARGARELNETLIRDCALEMGLVDYKVCSVDLTWSGLLFARK